MREKSVVTSTIERYIEFLKMVKMDALPNQSVSLTWIADKGNVAQAAPKALIELGIIKKEGKYWHWLKGEPSKSMVLEILNFNLNKTKKTIHYPIAGFEAIGETLRDISDKLMHITIQHEKSFKSPKNSSADIHSPTIFAEQQQRFEIIKVIAGSLYSGREIGYLNDVAIYGINQTAIAAADNLIEQLRQKQNTAY